MKNKVVISPKLKFFLTFEEVELLASKGEPWALSVASSKKEIFYPSQEELPRHSEQLIDLAEKTDRLESLSLTCKWTPWSPKYMIKRRFPDGGEDLIEPNSEGWKVLYYHTPREEMSVEEQNQRRINAIAP